MSGAYSGWATAVSAIVIVGATLACGHSTTAPTAPLSLVTAQPTSPASGAQISFYKQPVTLVISNATTSTTGASIVNHVEVATDEAFATIVEVHDIAQNSAGPTTVMLATLHDSTPYFWRVRTTAGAVNGPFSSPAKFTIGPLVVIQAPRPVLPLLGSLEGARPTLVVGDSPHSGPAGDILYRFEIATDPSFAAVAITGAVPEAPGQTSFTPSADLNSGAVFYWRAKASDTLTGATSPYTSTTSFRTQFSVIPGSFRMSLSPVSGGCGPSGAYPTVYMFDGTLEVIGSRLKFSANVRPRDLPPDPNPMTLDVTRAGGSVAGGIIGASHDRTGYYVSTAAGFGRLGESLGPARVSGTVTGSSTFAGTIDGALSIVHSYFSLATGCTGTHMWTLLNVS